MKVEFYSIPSYYIDNSIILNYEGITELLETPIIYQNYAQVDINNFIIEYNYFNFIERGINYVRIGSKFCYFISRVSMETNSNVRAILELDAPHTYEHLKANNILDNVGASFVMRALSTKALKYEKAINTFTFENDDITATTNDLFIVKDSLSSLDFGNDALNSTYLTKCIYLIVNENWSLLSNGGVYAYNSDTDTYSYKELLKEQGISTNKYLMVFPFTDSVRYQTGNNRIYANGTEVDANNISPYASSELDLGEYLSYLVSNDATNIIDYGLAYFPLYTMELSKTALPNATADICPIYFVKNIDTANAIKNYSYIYNDAYSNVYLKLGNDLKELPLPQDTTYIQFSLTYSISNTFQVLFKMYNLLTEKGFEVFDATDSLRMSCPVYIDGVERQTLLNSALIDIQRKQNQKQFDIYNNYHSFELAGSILGASSSALNRYEKTGNAYSSGYGFAVDTYNTMVSSFKMQDIKMNSYVANDEALEIKQKNLKYSTSSYTGGSNLNFFDMFVNTPQLYIVSYNNDYNEALYNIRGSKINRVVEASILSTLENTFISVNLNFNDSVNLDLTKQIRDLFSIGVYIFESDAEANDFITTGLDLELYEI